MKNKNKKYGLLVTIIAIGLIATILLSLKTNNSLNYSNVISRIFNASTQQKTKFVVDTLGNNKYLVIPPKNAGNSSNVHIYYKGPNDKDWIVDQKLNSVGSERTIEFKQATSKRTYRLLVQWPNTTVAPSTWKPSGWSYNSDIKWAYKDFVVAAKASNPTSGGTSNTSPENICYIDPGTFSIKAGNAGTAKITCNTLNGWPDAKITSSDITGKLVTIKSVSKIGESRSTLEYQVNYTAGSTAGTASVSLKAGAVKNSNSKTNTAVSTSFTVTSNSVSGPAPSCFIKTDSTTYVQNQKGKATITCTSQKGFNDNIIDLRTDVTGTGIKNIAPVGTSNSINKFSNTNENNTTANQITIVFEFVATTVGTGEFKVNANAIKNPSKLGNAAVSKNFTIKKSQSNTSQPIKPTIKGPDCFFTMPKITESDSTGKPISIILTCSTESTFSSTAKVIQSELSFSTNGIFTFVKAYEKINGNTYNPFVPNNRNTNKWQQYFLTVKPQSQTGGSTQLVLAKNAICDNNKVCNAQVTSGKLSTGNPFPGKPTLSIVGYAINGTKTTAYNTTVNKNDKVIFTVNYNANRSTGYYLGWKVYDNKNQLVYKTCVDGSSNKTNVNYSMTVTTDGHYSEWAYYTDSQCNNDRKNLARSSAYYLKKQTNYSDQTKPSCKFIFNQKNKQIKVDQVVEGTLICSDNESLKKQTFNLNSLEYDSRYIKTGLGKNIEISPNNNQVTVYITGKSVGTSNLSLKANTIYDENSNGNIYTKLVEGINVLSKTTTVENPPKQEETTTLSILTSYTKFSLNRNKIDSSVSIKTGKNVFFWPVLTIKSGNQETKLRVDSAKYIMSGNSFGQMEYNEFIAGDRIGTAPIKISVLGADGNTYEKRISVIIKSDGTDKTPPSCFIKFDSSSIIVGQSGSATITCTDNGFSDSTIDLSNLDGGKFLNNIKITGSSDTVNKLQKVISFTAINVGSASLTLKGNAVRDNQGNGNKSVTTPIKVYSKEQASVNCEYKSLKNNTANSTGTPLLLNLTCTSINDFKNDIVINQSAFSFSNSNIFSFVNPNEKINNITYTPIKKYSNKSNQIDLVLAVKSLNTTGGSTKLLLAANKICDSKGQCNSKEISSQTIYANGNSFVGKPTLSISKYFINDKEVNKDYTNVNKNDVIKFRTNYNSNKTNGYYVRWLIYENDSKPIFQQCFNGDTNLKDKDFIMKMTSNYRFAVWSYYTTSNCTGKGTEIARSKVYIYPNEVAKPVTDNEAPTCQFILDKPETTTISLDQTVRGKLTCKDNVKLKTQMFTYLSFDYNKEVIKVSLDKQILSANNNFVNVSITGKKYGKTSLALKPNTVKDTSENGNVYQTLIKEIVVPEDLKCELEGTNNPINVINKKATSIKVRCKNAIGNIIYNSNKVTGAKDYLAEPSHEKQEDGSILFTFNFTPNERGIGDVIGRGTIKFNAGAFVDKKTNATNDLISVGYKVTEPEKEELEDEEKTTCSMELDARVSYNGQLNIKVVCNGKDAKKIKDIVNSDFTFLDGKKSINSNFEAIKPDKVNEINDTSRSRVFHFILNKNISDKIVDIKLTYLSDKTLIGKTFIYLTGPITNEGYGYPVNTSAYEFYAERTTTRSSVILVGKKEISSSHPVYSIFKGTVTNISNDVINGMTIVVETTLDNGNIIETKYSYLGASTVSKGNPVVAGEKIGTTGTTGNAKSYCGKDGKTLKIATYKDNVEINAIPEFLFGENGYETKQQTLKTDIGLFSGQVELLSSNYVGSINPDFPITNKYKYKNYSVFTANQAIEILNFCDSYRVLKNNNENKLSIFCNFSVFDNSKLIKDSYIINFLDIKPNPDLKPPSKDNEGYYGNEITSFGTFQKTDKKPYFYISVLSDENAGGYQVLKKSTLVHKDESFGEKVTLAKPVDVAAGTDGISVLDYYSLSFAGSKDKQGHYAIDYVVSNADVYAFGIGVVNKIGHTDSGGYYVDIAHDFNYDGIIDTYSHYRHLNISGRKSEAAFVTTTTKIAKSSWSGLKSSTKAHLHFQVDNGVKGHAPYIYLAEEKLFPYDDIKSLLVCTGGRPIKQYDIKQSAFRNLNNNDYEKDADGNYLSIGGGDYQPC